MASLSGAEGGPEEPELSITLTLRMLMHGKVTAGNWGVGGGPCWSAHPLGMSISGRFPRPHPKPGLSSPPPALPRCHQLRVPGAGLGRCPLTGLPWALLPQEIGSIIGKVRAGGPRALLALGAPGPDHRPRSSPRRKERRLRGYESR